MHGARIPRKSDISKKSKLSARTQRLPKVLHRAAPVKLVEGININTSILIQSMTFMETSMNLEKRLMALDKELHDILNFVREQKISRKKGLVEDSLGAWGYDIDSKKFVDNLRRSKRLDWIK